MAKSRTSSPSDFSSLIPALSKVLEGVGNSPIRLEVALCDADEVKEYKQRVEELEALVEALRADYNRVEFKYRCECTINYRLHDFCREQGVQVPNSLFKVE